MKKILLASVALGLGLGLAASIASAEMSFTATGKYEAQGFYVSEGSDSSAGMQVAPFDKNLRWSQMANSGSSCSGEVVENDGDFYCFTSYDSHVNDMWHHSLYVYPKLQVNDNIALNGEIRFIDRDIWGTNQATGAVNNAADENMRLRLLWMDYMSPIGKWQVGRILGGGWGYTKFLDSTGNRDRIKWYPVWTLENVSWLLMYQKNAEKDAFDGGTDEADFASYYAGLVWNASFGGTQAAVWHNRFDQDYSSTGSYNNTELWFSTNYKLFGMNFLSEVHYAMGDDSAKDDISSWGAYADLSMPLGAFTLGGMVFWLQGDMTADGDNKGYVGRGGVGNDWNPFAIATGDYMGLLNGDKNGYLGAITGLLGIPGYELTGSEGDFESNSSGNGGQPGALALAAYAGWQFTEKLSFNAAAGYIWADKTPSGIDDAMGFEVDLGLSYKLLDNLTYSATFGYMLPGDMFDDLASYVSYVASDIYGEPIATGTNNIYLLLHNLTMTF